MTEITAVRIKRIMEIAMLLLNIRAMAQTVLKALKKKTQTYQIHAGEERKKKIRKQD